MRSILGFIFILSVGVVFAQGTSKYGVKLIDEYDYYQKQVEKDADYEMIDLNTVEGIDLDIRYATENNFTHKVVYSSASAFARTPVAEALKKANRAFNKLGFKIKVYDAYRPYDATVRFYELIKDTTYVASPYTGSRHNRACALDITLVDIESGKELEMPSGYDDFSKKAHPNYNEKDEVKRENRNLLIDTMEQYGFTVYPSEWWHFDFEGWERFPIMNLSFEVLKSKK